MTRGSGGFDPREEICRGRGFAKKKKKCGGGRWSLKNMKGVFDEKKKIGIALI